MLRRVAMMLLRGGGRALIFIVLGVIAYFAVTKLNLPSQDPKAQKAVLGRKKEILEVGEDNKLLFNVRV